MFELIEKLRKKPEHTKKRYAFLFAFFVSGIIFVVWLSIIVPDFMDQKSKEDKIASLEPSPFGAFWESFKTGTTAIGEQFSEFKKTISSISTNPSYYSATTTSGVLSIATTTEEIATTTVILEE